MSFWKRLFGANKSSEVGRDQSASIQVAAKDGDSVKVAALLKRNSALVFGKDSMGNTPLHWAAQEGHKDVAQLLLANGAEVDAKTKYDNTPLHRATVNGHKQVVELLLANKAEINAKSSDDWTPLHTAADNGCRDVAELLLASKADINAKERHGWTPLNLAARKGHKEVAELLLANKADVNIADENGQTPLLAAVKRGDKEVAGLLSRQGGQLPASSGVTFEMKVTGFRMAPTPTGVTPDGVEGDIIQGKIRLGDEIYFRRSGRRRIVTRLAQLGRYVNCADSNQYIGSPISVRFSNFSTQDVRPGDVLTSDNAEVEGATLQVKPIPTPVVLAENFAKHAAIGPAWSRLSIRDIPGVITELNNQMKQLCVPSDAIFDLYNNSLLGVCPMCNQYCAGKALANMPLLTAAANLTFTGDSGGFERMVKGFCLNYECYSTEFDLFWCPDLDPTLLNDLRQRGINIDPGIQRTRDHVWKPQSSAT